MVVAQKPQQGMFGFATLQPTIGGQAGPEAMRPFRLMKRVMAMRPASIWRSVTHPHSSAFSP